MLSTPFRSPLLKRHHSEDENGQHQSKKTKIFEAAGPRLIFKNPGVSSLPRKPLLEVTNKAGDPNPGASKGYYNVLWRHRSGKKHKTWEGDALCVVSDGHAELLDRDTGKSIGRTKCNQPLLPGSTLLLSGKDIEVDSVLSTSQYVEWKHSLAAKKPKEIRPPEHKKATETKVVKTQVKSTKPTAKIKQSPTTLPPDVPSAAATGQGRGDVPRSQNTRTTELLPRHSPHAPGAIVMKRPLDNKVDVVIDPLLSGKLREHQRDGVKFMYECVMGLRDYDGQGAILADEMGLGEHFPASLLCSPVGLEASRFDVPVTNVFKKGDSPQCILSRACEDLSHRHSPTKLMLTWDVYRQNASDHRPFMDSSQAESIWVRFGDQKGVDCVPGHAHFELEEGIS